MGHKPVVGEILYSLNIGDRARYSEQELTPVTVVKVGRKYFTVKENRKFGQEIQFHLNNSWTQRTEFIPNSKLYKTPRHWEEEKEMDKLLEELRLAVQRGTTITLYQLRRMIAIVNEGKKA